MFCVLVGRGYLYSPHYNDLTNRVTGKAGSIGRTLSRGVGLLRELLREILRG